MLPKATARRLAPPLFVAILAVLAAACGPSSPSEQPQVQAFGGILSPTTGPAQPNSYSGTHYEWSEEFNSLTIAYPFSATNSGAGTVTSSGTVGTTTRPGIWDPSTGTSNTGRSALTTSLAAFDLGSLTSATVEWTGGFPTLSDGAAPTEAYAFLVGFMDVVNAVNQIDGCYSLYDRANVATGGPNTGNLNKWSCWCASNGTTTKFLMDGSTVSNESFSTVDAPVAALTLPSTSIQTLAVTVTGTTRAEFYINGVKSCDINTNIPSGAARLTGAGYLLIKNAGTTPRMVNSDRLRLAYDLPARSP